MRYGYWLPVFGGWLRNVDDEGMEASWDVRQPARPAERGDRLRPDLDRRAQPQRHQGGRRAVARRLVDRGRARRGDPPARADGRRAADLPPPGPPRQAGGEHRSHQRRPAVAQRRLVVVGRRGDASTASSFDKHDDRYARTAEWLDVVDGVWKEARFSYRRALLPGRGRRLSAEAGLPARGRRSTPAASRRRPRSSSPATATPTSCTAIRRSGSARRSPTCGRGASALGLPPMQFGVAAYAIVRDSEARRNASWRAHHRRPSSAPPATPTTSSGSPGTQLERRVSLEEYSVSNRGLRAGLVGTPESRCASASQELAARRRRPPAAAVQPPARGDGALRRERHPRELSGN